MLGDDAGGGVRARWCTRVMGVQASWVYSNSRPGSSTPPLDVSFFVFVVQTRRLRNEGRGKGEGVSWRRVLTQEEKAGQGFPRGPSQAPPRRKLPLWPPCGSVGRERVPAWAGRGARDTWMGADVVVVSQGVVSPPRGALEARGRRGDVGIPYVVEWTWSRRQRRHPERLHGV